MKCVNCIHYDICQYHIDEETTMTVNECPHEFIHKDQYVKLPVYIGQPVWTVYQSDYSNLVTITEGKVSMVQQKADKSWKFRISRNGSVEDCTLNEVGARIFFNRAEAEERAERLRRYTVE